MKNLLVMAAMAAFILSNSANAANEEAAAQKACDASFQFIVHNQTLGGLPPSAKDESQYQKCVTDVSTNCKANMTNVQTYYDCGNDAISNAATDKNLANFMSALVACETTFRAATPATCWSNIPQFIAG